jgi:hypothetical protein
VPFDGVRADEQLRTDLLIGQTVGSQSRDLLLLSGELIARADRLLRTFSPVATNSRRARSVKPCAPMRMNDWWAVVSCRRASTRRFARRSHSPYDRGVREM